MGGEQVVACKDVKHIDAEQHGCLSLPLSRGSLSTDMFDQTPGNVGHLLVEIKGSQGDVKKVPLLPCFARRNSTPGGTPPFEFQKYLSQQLGRSVSAVFYPVQIVNGRRGSLALERFDMESADASSYPF